MLNKFILFISFLGLSLSVTAQLDRTKAPAAQPNPEIKIEIPEPMVFSNGLKVIMVENHKLPIISFQLFVDYPTTLEGDKAGLSSIFGEMLGSGTEKTPKDQFDEKIDYIGASFYANSRGFYASSLKKHTPELLTLLSQVVTKPAFTQADFDRIVEQNRSGLASLPSEASAMMSNLKSVVNYGPNHPYGEVMTEETLNNITLEDIRAYFDKNFIPNDAYLIIVGDINREELKQYVSQYFEQWEKGTDLEKQNYNTTTSKGNNVYFVNKPGAVQSVISISHTVELTPGHPDEIKLSVLNQILGGGSFSARLMSNLREDKAYTYGCYSSISSNQLMGSFSAGGSFRNEVTDSAIVQILEEIKKIAENPVTAKELDLTKKSMTGSFARSLEDPETIARFALNTVRYNLPSDYYSNYLKRLEKITIEDLLMAGATYLRPENINIFVVGNEEIADKLTVFDEDGKVDFKNYYGEDVEQLKAVPENVTVETIINRYLMATMMVKSDAELQAKLAQVKQIETISYAKQEGFKLYIYSLSGAPNKTASCVYVKSVQGNLIASTENFDGEAGQEVQQGKATVYKGDELAMKKAGTFPIDQLAYLTNPALKVEVLGIADLNGVPHYKLKIVENNELKFEYYNVETGLMTCTESYITENDEEITIVATVEKFEAQSGLMLPKNVNINQQGQLIKLETIRVTTSNKVKSKAYSGNFKKIEKTLMGL